MNKYLSPRFSLLFAILLLLVACGGSSSPATSTHGNIAATPTILQQAGTLPAILTTGNVREYPLPQTQSGLMRPVVDHRGRVWFGEMGHNFLAVFDPRTKTFQQVKPPHGANGIMGIAIAADDSIWFAEQYANYIGHYFPDTRTFRIYNLPRLETPDPSDAHKTLTLPLAPNDIVLDAHGNVWFTEMNADALGMLDVKSGHFKHYALTSQKSVQTLDPYGITIDPAGRVWFTESSTPRIGYLDPRTGHMRFFDTHTPGNPQMEIASDSHGTLWATSFTSGLLLKLEPQTATFTYYYTPHIGSEAGGIYGLALTPEGEVWVTVSAENKLARLDGNAHRFLYYDIPTDGSLPFGIAVGAHHTLWFTEANSDKIGMLQV